MSELQIPDIEVVERGIGDLRAGRQTAAALLVEIAAPRLRFLGLDVPAIVRHAVAAELRLYQMVCEAPDVSDPYRRYNDLLRRLSSTCRALESRYFAKRRRALGPRSVS